MLVFILLSNLMFLMHPIHLSITNISQVNDKNRFEVSVRLFRDDLEMIINHKYEQNIVLTDENISDVEEIFVNKYINDMLIFKEDDTLLDKKNISIEFDDLMIVASFILNYSNDISTLDVRNTLMMDAFRDQKNLLIINSNKKEKGYQFTLDNYQQKIVL